MCGGGGSSQPRPPQPVQMVSQPARTQQEIAAAQGGTTDQGAFGSELSAAANGGSWTSPTQPKAPGAM
jgi:hypothetical protein